MTDPAGPASDEHDDTAGLRSLESWGTTRDYLQAIWNRRDFVTALPLEQMRTSHLDTFLGNIWHLINPLLTAGVYYLIFGVFFQANRTIPNYTLWLVIGVFTYGLTQSSVLGGARSISDSQGLMRSFRFPRAIVPMASVISNLISFGFQFIVVVIVALLSGVGVSTRWLALPLILAMHTALNLGGAFVAARLNDAFADVQQLIPFVFRLLQYSSGVMFSVDRILASSNAWLRGFVIYNPLVSILDLYRWAIMGSTVDLRRAVIAMVTSVALLIFGFRFFRVAEHRYGKP